MTAGPDAGGTSAAGMGAAGTNAAGTSAAGTSAAGLDPILDAAPCGFLAFADDGTVLHANATLLALLGYARAEVEGRHVERLLTIAGRIFYQTHLFPLLSLHGRADEIFLLLRPKAGGDVGALVNAVRRERGGRPVTDCVLVPVRERRKYEDELLRARRAAEQASAELEARGRELERANEQLESQAVELELQQQQMQEQHAELEAASEDLHAINEALARQAEELDRRRAEADAANRAKSEFLAMMSHELRTPLNAIGGYVQLLEMGIHGPVSEAQRETLERVGRSQRHLLRLINEVLNLARIESGRVDYAMERVPLGEAVAAVLPMVEPQMAAKGLTCAVDVAPDAVARADRDKLQQILINLLTNAMKFTPPGGRVTVDSARRPGLMDVLFLRVRDTGIGIPAEKLESIFEPFVQVDVSHARRAEGTGLGLAISRDLARGMGGDLRARSVPGQGSTFTLVLAQHDAPA
jgi:PAS domain S-box-containing protein